MLHPTTNPHSTRPQHSTSRSNSISSSSVVTVHRTASFSSRPTSRNRGARPQSPLLDPYSTTFFSKRATSPASRRRPSVTSDHRNSVDSDVNDGVGNLNRWSQSTSSSKASSGHRNSNSFSRRLSIGGSGPIGSIASLANPHSPPTRNVLTKSRSPGSTPEKRKTAFLRSEAPPSLTLKTPAASALQESFQNSAKIGDRAILPPISTLPSLSQTVDATIPSSLGFSASSTTELLAPTKYGTATPEYFSDRWQGRTSPNPQRYRPTTPATLSDLPPRGHSRNQSDYTKGSGGSDATNSGASIRTSRDRERKHKRHPSQKAMLSKALQKANTAVLLDNAQNFEGAMDAYQDACDLLQQVLGRTPVDDDRRKLDAIRGTYLNRINELQGADLVSYQNTDGKALPERPLSDGSTIRDQMSPVDEFEEDLPIIETATATRIVNSSSYTPDTNQPRQLTPSQIPPRRQSLLPSGFDDEIRFAPTALRPDYYDRYSRSTIWDDPAEYSMNTSLEVPMESDCMPPPLSPRRPLSPNLSNGDTESRPRSASDAREARERNRVSSQQTFYVQHSRDPSQETTSWLDTIDESGGSSASSVHSRSSSLGPRNKQFRPPSGITEAEFDAALDAAVEAAYDDGYDLAENRYDEDIRNDHEIQDNHSDVKSIHEDPIVEDPVVIARRNIELAKERVREAEREAVVAMAKNREKRRFLQRESHNGSHNSIVEYAEDEAAEEERMLEEMTKEYILDEFEFDLQSKSALPRQSDSSGFSGRTWGSSIGSNPTTAGTSLSTVAEALMPSLDTKLQSKLPPQQPPPSGALPPPPTPSSQPPHPPPSMAPPAPPPSVPPPTMRSQASAPSPPGPLPAAPEQSLSQATVALPSVSALVEPFHPTSPPPPPPTSSTLPPRLESIHSSPESNEAAMSSKFEYQPLPAAPPPLLSESLQPSPPATARNSIGLSPGPGPGVRDRRLSGQNAKQLKIETNAKLKHIMMDAPRTMPPAIPPHSPPEVTGEHHLSTGQRSVSSQLDSPKKPTILEKWGAVSGRGHSPANSEHIAELSSAEPLDTAGLTKTLTIESENEVPVMAPPSPTRLLSRITTSSRSLRKNFSSSSLRSRNLSVSTPDIPDVSPGTPMNNLFSGAMQARKGLGAGVPVLPTPTGGSFTVTGMPTGGIGGFFLFESDIHSPTSPGSPNPDADNPPVPLEPCPASFLLRPFWLMRALYQTIAHPRGGYISKKLFVPREVWRVKVPKVKNVDEKVSNCDLLTAALLKLASVDTFDADAVLEEMQSLEVILDQVQIILSKKLGNEVGLHGSTSFFKGSTTTEDSTSTNDTGSKPTSSGKSYLSSWRKLRSKNSGTMVTPPTITVKDSKDNFTIESVPTTSLPNVRFAKRDVSKVQCDGPNQMYMAALVRLFDAAQVLDQIARQVEDPGLKHSNSTQVGLELCARHAAEFFAFYICRFVLNDLGIMLDKFLKKGTEWVLV